MDQTPDERRAQEIARKADELRNKAVVQEVLNAADTPSIDAESAMALRGFRREIDQVLKPEEKSKIESALQKYEREKESRKILAILEAEDFEGENAKALLKTPVQKVWEYIQADFKRGKNKKKKRKFQSQYIGFLESTYAERPLIRNQVANILALGNLPPEFVNSLKHGDLLKKDRDIADQLIALVLKTHADRSEGISAKVRDDLGDVLGAIESKGELEKARLTAASPDFERKREEFLQKLKVLGGNVMERAKELLNTEEVADREAVRKNRAALANLLHTEWQAKMEEAVKNGVAEAKNIFTAAENFFLGDAEFGDQGLVDFFDLPPPEKAQYLSQKRAYFQGLKKYLDMAEQFENPTEFLATVMEFLKTMKGSSADGLEKWELMFKNLHHDFETQRDEALRLQIYLDAFTSDLHELTQAIEQTLFFQGAGLLKLTPETCAEQTPELWQKFESFFEKHDISELRQTLIWQYLRHERDGTPNLPYEATGAVTAWGEKWKIRDGQEAARAVQRPETISGLNAEYLKDHVRENIPAAFAYETGEPLSPEAEFDFKALNLALNVLATRRENDTAPQRLIDLSLQDGLEGEVLKLISALEQYKPVPALAELQHPLRETITAAAQERAKFQKELEAKKQNFVRLRDLLKARQMAAAPELVRQLDFQIDAIGKISAQVASETFEDVVGALRGMLESGVEAREVASCLDEALMLAQQRNEALGELVHGLDTDNQELKGIIAQTEHIEASGEIPAQLLESLRTVCELPGEIDEKTGVFRQQREMEAAEAEAAKAAQIPEIFRELQDALAQSPQEEGIGKVAQKAFLKLQSIEFNGTSIVAPFAEYHPLVGSTGFFFDSISFPPRILIRPDIYEALKNGRNVRPDHVRGVLHEMGHLLAANSDIVKRFIQGLKQKGVWAEFCQRTAAMYGQKTELRKSIIFGERYKKLNERDRAEEFVVSYLTGAQYENLEGFGELKIMLESIFSPEELRVLLAVDPTNFAHTLASKILPRNNMLSRLWRNQGALKGEDHAAVHQAPEHDHSHAANDNDPHAHAANDHHAHHGNGREFDEERKQAIEQEFAMEKKLLEEALVATRKIPHKQAGKYVNFTRDTLQKLEQAVLSVPKGEALEKRFEWGLKELKKIKKDIQEKSSIMSGGVKSGSNLLMFWNERVTLASLSTFGKGFELIKHEISHLHERNDDRRSGEIVEAGAKEINKNVAAAGVRKQKEAERTAVSGYQENMDELDVPELYHEIHEMVNKDEFKAALRVLAKKGSIDWRDKTIWRAIEKLGGGVKFEDSDADNLMLLAKKMQDGLTRLFDAEEYKQLERDNLSNYDSRKGQFEKEADQLQGILVSEIKNMIQMYRNDKGSISPQRYEMFVETLIKKGKGAPKDAIYYLILGVYEGIISPERVVAIDSVYLNNYPITQFIDNNKATRGDYKKWVEGNGFASHGHMPISMPFKFGEWVHYKAQTNVAVEQRFAKALTQGIKFDHDHFQFIAGQGSKAIATTLFSLNTNGEPNQPVTGMANLFSGILEHSVLLAANRKNISKEENIRILASQAGYFAAADAISGGRLYSEGKYYRFNDEQRNDPIMLRDAGIFDSDKVRTIQDCVNLNQRMFRIAAPAFFDKLAQPLQVEPPREGERLAGSPKKLAEEKRFRELFAILQHDHADFLQSEFTDKHVPLPADLDGIYSVVETLVKYELKRNDVLFTKMTKEAEKIARENSTDFVKARSHANDNHAHGGHGHGHAHAA